jgi:WD40 repeat protein
MKKFILYLLSTSSLLAMERPSTVPALKALAALNFIKLQTKRKREVASNPLPIPEADLADILKTSLYWPLLFLFKQGSYFKFDDIITSAAVSLDTTRIVLGFDNGGTVLVDFNTGKVSDIVKPHNPDPEDPNASSDEESQDNPSVTSVSFSPDGTKVAIGYKIGSVDIKNIITGQEIAFDDDHEDEVTSVNFSPDGTKALTVSSNRGSIIDTTTGTVITTFTGGWMHTGEFSPDGTKILITPLQWPITLSRALGQISIIDVATGSSSILFEEQDKENYITSAHFNPEGTTIVISLNDGKIKILNALTGTLSTTLHYDTQVNTTEFSPDGTKLVTASNNGTVRIIDTLTYSVLATIKHDCEVFSVNFSLNGEYMVTNCGSQAKIIEVATGKLIVPIRFDDPINFIQFSSDTKKIITLSNYALHVYRWPTTITDKGIIRAITDKDIIKAAQKYLFISEEGTPRKRPRTK